MQASKQKYYVIYVNDDIHFDPDYNHLQTLTVIPFLLVISYKIKHFNA